MSSSGSKVIITTVADKPLERFLSIDEVVRTHFHEIECFSVETKQIIKSSAGEGVFISELLLPASCSIILQPAGLSDRAEARLHHMDLGIAWAFSVIVIGRQLGYVLTGQFVFCALGVSLGCANRILDWSIGQSEGLVRRRRQILGLFTPMLKQKLFP